MQKFAQPQYKFSMENRTYIWCNGLQQDLERLQSLRYMDDFMTVCLADDFEGIELIVRIVLGRKDIKIKSDRTQEVLENLQGRSAI